MAESTEHSSVFDTGQQQLGATYAKALLGAVGTKGAESVLAEFDAVIDLLAQLPRLDATLSSPRIAHEEKERVLDKAFGKKLSDTLLKFLKVVSRHGRLDCLRAIVQAAHAQHNQACGRVEVKLKTAAALDSKTVQALIAKLESSLGQDVLLKQEVDESLIGGVVIQIGDTVYDGSLSNRLVKLREETIQNTAQSIRDAIERFTLAD